MAVFRLLRRKDSYGFPVARPKGMEMRQEYPRYLRAVIETSLPDQQAVSLVEAWHKLRAEAADFWFQAAAALGDRAQALQAR